MTTGSHHYQTYWVPGDAKYGRLLQTLPLIWLKKDQRWIPREAAFMHPPGVRMITQWNHHCIRCHSTGGVPGVVEKLTPDGSQAGAAFETRVADLGIACEACHGPARAHVEANQDPLHRYDLHHSGRSDPTIVNPERLDHKRSTQVCGQCHGVYVHDDEGMHGFKVQWYLSVENEMRRMMWRLAHAHGTLFSVLHLCLAATLLAVPKLPGREAAIASACFTAALVVMPAGFLLGGIWLYHGDPGLGIVLIPAGATLLLVGVVALLAALWRTR